MILLDVKTLKTFLKVIFERRLKTAIADPNLRHDQLRDNNNITLQIMISFAFKTFRLIIIMFTISYFIGTLWYIFVWQVATLEYDINHQIYNNFYTYYKLDLLKEENKDLDR